MTNTIGRVDFLVSLDGRNLPAEARRLGNQIGATGAAAGNQFGKQFGTSFDRRLSTMGDRVANVLSGKGALAGEKFSATFSRRVTGKFRAMQNQLASILSDKDAFRKFADGFDTVDLAVDQVIRDLQRLRSEEYINEKGKKRLALTAKEFSSFSTEARRLGSELKLVEKVEQDFTATQNRLRVELSQTESAFQRLTRLAGDKEAFTGFAERVGGTGQAFERLRDEIETTGSALGRTSSEIESTVDRLERTRDAADRSTEKFRLAEQRTHRLELAFRKLGRTLLLRNAWDNIDNDVRLVIGLIAGAADQIAVLGSALGAGFIGVGGAASAAVTGVGGLAATFVTLSKNIEDLPPELRDVAEEFKALGPIFSNARETIAISAFRQMPGVFDSIGESVLALDPAFTNLGDVTGRLFRDFARSVEPGSEALENIFDLIDIGARQFDQIARSAGTLGGALVRSFVKAEPLVQDLIGWVDRLVDSFDAFTRSSAFDTWVSNAQTTFGALGRLLDALGTGLNNLATPAAVLRTEALLDNLTGFVPALTSILDVIGRSDPLGLFAQALNEAGEALGPLIEALGPFADQLNRILSLSLEEFGDALGGLAAATVPLVNALTDFLAAIPEDVVRGAANGLLVLGGAFLLFKGAKGIAGAATVIENLTGKLDKLTGASPKLAGLTGALGKAGLWGAAIAGMVGVTKVAEELATAISGVDDKARDLIGTQASLVESVNKLNGIGGVTTKVGELTEGLEKLGQANDFFGRIALGFDSMNASSQAALELGASLRQLDDPLAKLAQNNLPAASSQFAAWADELVATDDQVLEMINTMPGFKQALEDASLASGGLASDQELVALALGRTSKESADATRSSEKNADALARLEGKSRDTEGAIDDLADSIKNFGKANLDTREAQRELEDSFDRVSESIAENGRSLDITTEAGRSNQETLDRLAESALDYSASVLEQTGSQEKATEALEGGRSKLLEVLKQFGITGQAAEDYADDLGLIPENIKTTASLNTSAATKAADTFVRTYDGKTITMQLNVDDVVVNGRVFGGLRDRSARGGVMGGDRFASGTVFNNFTRFGRNIVAESNAEALVPLNRPLSLVDPAVRELSAFAQGLIQPTNTGGKQITVGPGAIQITSTDPWRAATETVNQLVERVLG
jgi:hypothetical protein